MLVVCIEYIPAQSSLQPPPRRDVKGGWGKGKNDLNVWRKRVGVGVGWEGWRLRKMGGMEKDGGV